MKRRESTAEQIEGVIRSIPYTDPCPFVLAVEICPELEHDPDWAKTVPPHAVIYALHHHAEHYRQLLDEERAKRQEAETALVDLADALRKAYKAAVS